MIRTVCLIITSHIHYARSRQIIKAIRKRKDLRLQIIVGASAILPQYGDVLGAMKEDKLTPDAMITMTLAGGSPVAMAKTTGIGITEFSTAFENLKPDIVLLRGDRYEVLAAAVAAAYMNIPIAHIEGGDRSGSIDESVRHAVTKLAHVHFPTNDDARRRIIRMGEDPRTVFTVGCPELEELRHHKDNWKAAGARLTGVGSRLDLRKPFLLVMHHPVTTEGALNRAHTEALLQVIHRLKAQTLWFWPNVDAGTDDVSKAIRVFREHTKDHCIHFEKYVSPAVFLGLLKHCQCIVGNSSAGIKEASYLGIPTVNIGTRQHGRTRGPNVVDCGYDEQDLLRAIERQMKRKSYPPSDVYYRPNCSEAIAGHLASSPLTLQKSFVD